MDFGNLKMTFVIAFGMRDGHRSVIDSGVNKRLDVDSVFRQNVSNVDSSK